VTLRRLLLKVHLYAGLATGTFLIVVAFTGSILAFAPDYDRWLNPSLWNITARHTVVSEQTLIEGLQRRFAGGDPATQIAEIALSGPNTAQVVTLANGVRVFVDPYAGTVLGTRRGPTRLESFLLFVRVLHSGLLAGEWGRLTIDAVTAVVALIIIPLGIALWWNQKRATVSWSSSWKRINWDLHSATGIYAGGFLLVLAVSGLFLGSEAPLYLLTRSSPQPVATIPRSTIPDGTRLQEGMSRPPLDSMLRAADRALPGAPTFRILLPPRPRSSLQVFKLGPAGVGHSTVYLDQYTGAVIRVDDFSHAPRAYQAHMIDQAIHMGAVFGLPVRILVALSGLTLVLLAISGTLIWWRRAV